MNNPTDTRALVRALGGPSAVARHLNISRVAVVRWPHVPANRAKGVVELAAKRGYRLPDGHALTMAALRPDIF